MVEVGSDRLFKRKCHDLLAHGVAQVYAYVHRITIIPVVKHSLGDGRRGVVAVGENTDFSHALDQRLV